MDQERQAKIKSALQLYRDTVSQHNKILIHAVAQAIEAQPVPPNWSASEAQEVRMREFSRLLRLQIPESITWQHLLNDDVVLTELIRIKHLDGIASNLINSEQREEYFAKIRIRILETVQVDVIELPPADLAYLCTLVSGITGPGLSWHHEAQQFDFISPIRNEQQLEEMLKAVVVPIRDDGLDNTSEPTDMDVTDDLLMGIWENWDIAVAFKTGSGPRWGGSYALYCRRDEAKDKSFKWRYGVHDEDWRSDVYDSVEEFLGFYAHFKEQTEQKYIQSIRPLTRSRIG